MEFQTSQEQLWGDPDFGNDYQQRNNDISLFKCKKYMYKQVFKHIDSVSSVIEFGPNIGLNLKAITELNTNINDIRAVELNKQACEILKTNNYDVIEKSITDYNDFDKKYDFVLSAGLLIHLQPSLLERAYKVLYESSKRYICIAEYYDPNPVSIPYRGHNDKLFKRDFAGEMMDKYPDLKLVDYKFTYKRDNKFPLDDITWFLLEK
jgi:spore coat polysaccharide biosynthesis protein SpsF